MAWRKPEVLAEAVLEAAGLHARCVEAARQLKEAVPTAVELARDEKQGRGLAGRHGKGSKCQRGEGVGPEGRGAGQVVSQGSEGHAAGGETTVAVALCRSGEAGGRG